MSDVQITDLSDALSGATVAIKVSVPPAVKVAVVLFKLTPVTGSVPGGDALKDAVIVVFAKYDDFQPFLTCKNVSKTYQHLF